MGTEETTNASPAEFAAALRHPNAAKLSDSQIAAHVGRSVALARIPTWVLRGVGLVALDDVGGLVLRPSPAGGLADGAAGDLQH